MGRKDNSKSKEKKQERKAMEMKMNAGVATIKKANAQTNPLEPLPSFQVFQKNGVNLKIEARRVTELDTETRDWIMDLLERNMKDLYIQSEWGYNPETKRSELMEDAAWYLLAREADTNKPVAFSHFRCKFFQRIVHCEFYFQTPNFILSSCSDLTWTMMTTCSTATRSSSRNV